MRVNQGPPAASTTAATESAAPPPASNWRGRLVQQANIAGSALSRAASAFSRAISTLVQKCVRAREAWQVEAQWARQVKRAVNEAQRTPPAVARLPTELEQFALTPGGVKQSINQIRDRVLAAADAKPTDLDRLKFFVGLTDRTHEVRPKDLLVQDKEVVRGVELAAMACIKKMGSEKVGCDELSSYYRGQGHTLIQILNGHGQPGKDNNTPGSSIDEAALRALWQPILLMESIKHNLGIRKAQGTQDALSGNSTIKCAVQAVNEDPGGFLITTSISQIQNPGVGRSAEVTLVIDVMPDGEMSARVGPEN